MAFLNQVKVCAAHVAPIFLDTRATVEKACLLIREAARSGAKIIAFPETFIPAFPVWTALGAPIHGHDFFRKLAAAAITVPGKEVNEICRTAKANEIIVSIGINEGTNNSVGCIWNSNLLIGVDGLILNHHRKLVPTFYEKLVWANGDGAGLRVCETEIGRIGMLICGENTNPLARYAMIAQGEQIHISSFPPIWPTRDPKESGRYDLESSIRIRSGAHAFEGKLFNIVVSSVVDDTLKNALRPLGKEAMRIIEDSPRGVSMIIGPSGETIGSTLSKDEGLLYGDINLADCVEFKQFHDIAGYYNRFDIFELTVNMARTQPIVLNNRTSLDSEQSKQMGDLSIPSDAMPDRLRMQEKVAGR